MSPHKPPSDCATECRHAVEGDGHEQLGYPDCDADNDIDEVMDTRDKPRERDQHDDPTGDTDPQPRRSAVKYEHQAAPDHRAPERVATWKPGTVGSRNVDDQHLNCRRKPPDSRWFTSAWRSGKRENVLEDANETNIREHERKNEQSPTPIDVPTRELITSNVEEAAERKEKPHVAH